MPSGNANKFLRAHQGHQLSSSQPCREKSHHVLTSISSLAVHTGMVATLPCTFYVHVNVQHAYKIKDKTPKLTSWRWHIAYLLFLNTMRCELQRYISVLMFYSICYCYFTSALCHHTVTWWHLLLWWWALIPSVCDTYSVITVKFYITTIRTLSCTALHFFMSFKVTPQAFLY